LPAVDHGGSRKGTCSYIWYFFQEKRGGMVVIVWRVKGEEKEGKGKRNGVVVRKYDCRRRRG